MSSSSSSSIVVLDKDPAWKVRGGGGGNKVDEDDELANELKADPSTWLILEVFEEVVDVTVEIVEAVVVHDDFHRLSSLLLLLLLLLLWLELKMEA